MDTRPPPQGNECDAAVRRPVVLVVDDLADNLRAMESALRRDDVDIATARSGRAALEILEERDVAVALVDVQMPEMDGFELAAHMRESEKARAVPIVFVTAGATDSARVFRGYESGAVDYLSKPVDERVLRGKVDVFVTLALERERLRHAERVRDALLATVSHDLRNPLGTITISAQLALMDSTDPRINNLLEVILRGGKRMARIIDQLLDPTAAVDLEPSTPPFEREIPPLRGGDAEGRRVLVVEDEEGSRMALKELLRGDGFRVEVASSGEEALAMLAELRPDALVVDLCLPGMDGVAFAGHARAWRASLPVLLMSGHDGSHAAFATLLREPSTEHVQKPIEFDTFVDALERLLAAPTS